MCSWNHAGDNFFLGETKPIPVLEPAIYRVSEVKNTIYLVRVQQSYEFPYKLYGLDTKFIERVKKTFAHPDFTGNLGILLSGLKGTGKTVTAKQLCNQLGLPVLVVTTEYAGFPEFLSNIKQEVVVFIDEYEKIYRDTKTPQLLPLMDGAMDTGHRRVFLLTTNSIDINYNMIQRPGRIRYHKQYQDLSKEVIAEIVTDKLVHREHLNATIEFIALLNIITVDIVQAVVAEVNIHNEPPLEFGLVFNVCRTLEIYDIYSLGPEDAPIEPTLVMRANQGSTLKHVGHVGGGFFDIGTITKIIDEYTYVIRDYNTHKKDIYQMRPISTTHRAFKEKRAKYSWEPAF